MEEHVQISLERYEAMKQAGKDFEQLVEKNERGRRNLFFFLTTLVKNNVYFVDREQNVIGHDTLMDIIQSDREKNIEVFMFVSPQHENGHGKTVIVVK